MRRSVSVNVIANYVGIVATAILQLFLVPINLRLLGVEQYGLIGFSMTLQAVLGVLDLGLSPAINRELARGSALGAQTDENRDLVRTLEGIYWITAISIAVGVVAVAPLLGSRWIHADIMRPHDVQTAIAVMGLTLALQFPISIYGGGLLGLERQALYVAVNLAMNVAFSVGAILIVAFVWRSVHAYFAWRAIVSLCHAMLFRYLLWRSLGTHGGAPKPRFRLSALSSIWRFSVGMTAIGVTGVALMQTDKIVLSKLLPLEKFGYYMLASSAAAMLSQLGLPVFTAVFPRLSHLVASRDVTAQRAYFHSCAQLSTVVVCPAAVTLALFSHDTVAIWTGNQAMAAASGPVLSVLSIGTALNCFMVLPFALQLANGWTKLAVTVNMVLVCLTVPYTIVAARYFGMVAAASAWIVLNVINVVAAAPPTLRRLLPGEGWRWLIKDVVVPTLAATSLSLAVWLLVPRQDAKLLIAARIGLALALSYAVALLSAGDVRRQLVVFGGAVHARLRAGIGARA